MGSSQQEKQVVHPPDIMTETRGDTTIPRKSRQQPSHQRAQSFTIVNLTGNSQSTAEVEEIETSRPQVVGAGSVNTPMAGYPRKSNTNYL